MTRLLSIAVIFSLVFLTNTCTFAANKCSALMNQKVADVLSPERLAAQDLRLNEFDALIDLKDGQVIGSLTLIDAPYVYEWAPLDYQKVWMQNGSIETEEMSRILRQPPQLYGVGYYVSTNPFDSSSFGDGLTAYKTSGPIVRLQAASLDYKSKKLLDLSVIDRMQKAGVDAMGSHRTWISLISTRHLKVAKNLITDPVWINPNSTDEIARLAFRLRQSGLQKFLPASLRLSDEEVQNYFAPQIKKIAKAQLSRDLNRILAIYDVQSPKVKTKLWPLISDRLEKVFSSLPEEEKNEVMKSAIVLDTPLTALTLVHFGGNVNSANIRKTTLFMSVTGQLALEHMKLLVDAGANVTAFNLNDDTALTVATRKGSIEKVEYLLNWKWRKWDLLRALNSAEVPEIKKVLAAAMKKAEND